MPVHGFSHYNLRAPQPLLDALRDFYVDIVGLTVGPRPPFDRPGHWLYAGGEAVLHLIAPLPGEERRTDVQTTFDHAAFTCSDRAGYERRLRAAGIAWRLAEVPQTGQRQLFLRDPAGNGVELNFDPVVD